MITVGIALHELIYRDGLTDFLGPREGFQAVGLPLHAEDVAQFVAESGAPHIVVVDLDRPQPAGYQIVDWVHTHCPGTKILAFSEFHSENLMAYLLKMDVCGFLEKNVTREIFREALRHVANNDTLYLGGNDGRLVNLLRHIGDPAALNQLLLTEREIEFIKQVCKGYPYQVIAKNMRVSRRTAFNIRLRVLKKLQVKGRMSMVMCAVRRRIVYL